MDIFDAAALLGAVPILWLTLRYWIGRRVSVVSWWIASGFAVSLLTDLVVRSHPAWGFVASPVYLVSQAALMTAAFLPPMEAWGVLFTLVAVGEAALLFVGPRQPDVLLHTTAFLLTLIVGRKSRYRWSFASAFGAGLLAWWGYCLDPGWPSWLAYQSCRLVGVILFCWASVE